MPKLRDIPILGNVYAVVAALGLVALIVGGIGVDAVYTTTARVRQLEQVANRAFYAERANALIYAVVMESRGIYMSSDAADRAKFGEGVKGFLRQLEANMADWKTHIRPERREQFRRAEDRAEEFVRFRTELVRLGNEEGQAAAREWGDNNANRTNRQALNGEIDALATQNYERSNTATNDYPRDHGWRHLDGDLVGHLDGEALQKGCGRAHRVQQGTAGGA
jgi:methyl-accepting chemotaxis protein